MRAVLCSVDLASTFYALNPSGDLEATQATFQDWFRGMQGWEVRAHLAAARQQGSKASWVAVVRFARRSSPLVSASPAPDCLL